MKLTSGSIKVLQRLKSTGFRPYIVGGSVRDHLLSVQSKDVDIEVFDCPSSEALVESLAAYFKIDSVGVAFGVLKVFVDDETIDVSLPRRDSKVFEGHRGFAVDVDPTMTLKEALSRRDFTVNSIAYDPFMNHFYDPFGGIVDIQRKVLRHTSDAFSEDPLRVLRGVQFACRFGFSMSDETQRLSRSLINQYSTISKERVWTEWEKMLLKGSHWSAAMNCLRQTGWIQHFPSLTSVVGGLAEVASEKCDSDMCDSDIRAATILAALTVEAKGREIEILAPRKLIRDGRKLSIGVMKVRTQATEEDVMEIARIISPFTIKDLSRCFMFGVKPIQDRARALGILDQPIVNFVTGDDLIERGLQPGPHFKTILDQMNEMQTKRKVLSREEALQELDRLLSEGVGSFS